MKSILNKIAAGLLLTSLWACSQDDLFTKEQYKKVVFLLSQDNKSFPVVHNLNEKTSTGYVTIYVGGTVAIEQDVTVTLGADDTLLDEYNKSNFDIDSTKFARILSPDRYKIENYTVTLKVGSENPYVLMPIQVTPEGLSPDSTYFIPLRIISVSNYEINEEKDNVLYQVVLENDYAEQANQTLVFMKGTKHEETAEIPVKVATNKRLYPLTKSSVRLNAGMENSTNTVNEDLYKKFGMIMTISDEKLVDTEGQAYQPLSLTAYRSNLIQIEQLGHTEDDISQNPQEANRYLTDAYGVTRYFLSYRYRTAKTLDDNGIATEWNIWTTMYENLKVPKQNEF